MDILFQIFPVHHVIHHVLQASLCHSHVMGQVCRMQFVLNAGLHVGMVNICLDHATEIPRQILLVRYAKLHVLQVSI